MDLTSLLVCVVNCCSSCPLERSRALQAAYLAALLLFPGRPADWPVVAACHLLPQTSVHTGNRVLAQLVQWLLECVCCVVFDGIAACNPPWLAFTCFPAMKAPKTRSAQDSQPSCSQKPQ